MGVSFVWKNPPARAMAACLCFASLLLAPRASHGQTSRPATRPMAAPYIPTDDEKRLIRAKIDELDKLVAGLRAQRVDESLLADVEISGKAARWILAFPEEFFSKMYPGYTLSMLNAGIERAMLLQQGRSPWTQQKGFVIRGYHSRLDDSVQIYGVIVPSSYDAAQPARLDVNLHGRRTPLSEVNFFTTYAQPKNQWLFIQPAEGQIQIDVYGRWNNAFHGAGEVDVFEAIAAVQKAYNIDPAKIVLRGFSLGGTGAWHLALHHPDFWAAVDAGAGNNKSRLLSGDDGLKRWQTPTLRIDQNLCDWALNAFNVPLSMYGGEIDTQLQACMNIRDQLVREGFDFEGPPLSQSAKTIPTILTIAPQTAHELSAESMKRVNAFLSAQSASRQRDPDRVRFMTYTTRYADCFWVTLDGLDQHYERGEVDAKRSADRSKYDITTKNLSRLILRQTERASSIRIDGLALPVSGGATLRLEKSAGQWQVAAPDAPAKLVKRPGLQGPIDDAFMDPFLCVRPTGKPWNVAANEQALRILDRFDRLYSKFFRAHPRVKSDRDVTDADIAQYHLILFGDPGSNLLIARIQNRLPIQWSQQSVALAGQQFSAADHLPTLIYPNPLTPARYVVLNSGLTATDADYRTDYLTPRLADYAVLKVDAASGLPEPAMAGFFDEFWEMPKPE